MKTAPQTSADTATAAAFAHSWNTLPPGSVYTRDQVDDWLAPVPDEAISGKRILELGCGGGSLLVHVLEKHPAEAVGVDLGDSVAAARRNLAATGYHNWTIEQADLCQYFSESGFDFVYCIGVLHHCKDPQAGFASILANTRPGARFHGWVYAHEGNALVRILVDPLRRICSRLPWWLVKYGVASPLAFLYMLYAKTIARFPPVMCDVFPMGAYSRWIAQREYAFFRHVAFDQLVTPQTVYIRRSEVEAWLKNPLVNPESSYIVQRNGNSWKFGGLRKEYLE